MKIEDIIDRPLVYRKVCKYGHKTQDGRNVKFTNGHCVGCKIGLPDDTVYSVTFTNVSEPLPYPRKKYFTDEERRQSRIDQQMRWNNKNKDKIKAYQKKYHQKEEVKEKNRSYYRENYKQFIEDLKTRPEEYKKYREDRRAYAKQYYIKNKEKHDTQPEEKESHTPS